MLATTKRRVETLESHVHHISEFSVRNTKSTTRRHTTKHKPWSGCGKHSQHRLASTSATMDEKRKRAKSHQMPNS